jgi:HEAT repeat protein
MKRITLTIIAVAAINSAEAQAPVDSMYRLGREVLNRGDYGRAAQIFREITERYSPSRYDSDLAYYEAWARHKIGTTDELRRAAKLLEPRASRLIGTSAATAPATPSTPMVRQSASDNDVASLYVRINSALAGRGDRAATDVMAKVAQAGAPTCDVDEMQLRAEAMNALSQMEPAQSIQLIRRVVESKDPCSSELRRRAVFVLGRRGDSVAANLLALMAKNDPSTSVRIEAISWLPKLQGELGIQALEQLLREESDERVQRAVVRTLNSSDNQRARSSMRALIDRANAPLSLRLEAINAFNNERVTRDDAAFLRNTYTRVEIDQLKLAIIDVISRMGGSDNDQWLLSLARNQNEASQLRAHAITRLVRATTPLSDLIKLYDLSDTYDVRARLVSHLERRPEAEAADKLYDIVKNSTVTSIKLQALGALNRRAAKDPHSARLVQQIIDGRTP